MDDVAQYELPALRPVEIWTVGVKRPRGLPDYCVHVPCVTRDLGRRLRGAPASGPSWGWWRSDADAQQRGLPAGAYADIEPDAWPVARDLRDHELEIAATSAGVTGYGYPTGREGLAIRRFAELGRRGVPQLYRGGNDPSKGARAAQRRIERWREIGFADVVGLLGGRRSGRRWVLDQVEACDELGVGVAFWGWDSVVAEASRLAFDAGLGRG